ncbi:conserved hypothetical protein [Pediculus humanus corporis]|uniref:UNC93-like protein n=1 Tax=Pediculus humanus subsp. corporis TaxID=121224 RepID=E0W1U1_PEDHC|nr:uncharacterized protein Phum_PHUM582480 [Pediculus humanus corporis]EEB19673.1 conserved hypothetical protein [Pediculus humanus corporis]
MVLQETDNTGKENNNEDSNPTIILTTDEGGDRGVKPVGGDDEKKVSETNGKDEDDTTRKSIELTDEELAAKGKFKMSAKEKWRILKNVTTVSLAFMVQFTAFQGTANLQSSINAKDGLGTASLSSIYMALVLSCLFVPTYLIKKLTAKWTLCLSMLCYAPYIAAQFYPTFGTLIPSGILLGIGAAPMWASKATYLTQVGGVYAKITNQAVDGIIVRFFGFFFLAWQTSELWGNLISSLVLSSGVHKGISSNYVPHNVTDEALLSCGANFCMSSKSANENLERPPDWEIYEISGIYLVCILLAVLMVAFLVDPLSRYGEKQKKKDVPELTGLQLFTATAVQLKKPLQQLLIPITVWIGMEQAFIGADYTQAFISCALGISYVGYVMICFGVVNAICSVLFGTLMKYIGRFPIMTFGFIVHFSLVIFKLIWAPSPDHPFAFFIVSGLWGVGDAVWQTQVNGLYGTLFRRKKEAAFSNYRLWESVGFVIAYAYSTSLCANMKLYVLLAILCTGFLGYIIVEILQKRKKKRQQERKDSKAVSTTGVPPPPTITEAELATSGKDLSYSKEETDDEIDDIDDDIIVTQL